MPDRSSFIAAIAANPDDDLPRLVFADWLDEHGEPERAEFIRVQVEAEKEPVYERRKTLDRRAADLFDAHWPDWFGPVFAALNGPLDPRECYQIADDVGIEVRDLIRSDHVPLVTQLHTSRGFVGTLSLNAARTPAVCSFAAALGREPISRLRVELSGDPQEWPRLTEPALRRVTHLDIDEYCHLQPANLPGMRPLFADPHLSGVRSLYLSPTIRGEDGIPTVETIPFDVVREFERSPLAYRLEKLVICTLTRDGLRRITGSDRLHLHEVTLGVEFGVDDAGPIIADTRFAPVVQSLQVWANLGNAGVRPLAASTRWHRLTELLLPADRITDAGLHALANAEFTPHLEVLDLRGNPLSDGSGDLDGLRELAAALNPGCLRLLNLANTGLDGVPDFLATTFGDRVAW